MGVVLLTGGAGYVGSHALLALREHGREAVAFDDLSEGHAAALLGAPLIRGSLLDPVGLRAALRAQPVDAVMHFAARCYVGESVRAPERYYRTNVVGTLELLEAMAECGVGRLVFSSSCAVYGEPREMPIREGMPLDPVNPYGRTKLQGEQVIADFARARGIDAIALRYFNAAGADPEGRLGEDHDPETHLIPLAVRAALGQGPPVTVYGSDYETADGTCIRDYVHVSDLAQAHALALLALEAKGPAQAGFAAFNLGNACGASVLQVLHAIERIAGRPVPHLLGARRPGDPPVLVGSAERVTRELGWRPRWSGLDTIVETAWRWHQRHPRGFAEHA